jgi:replicative DNA helicase
VNVPHNDKAEWSVVAGMLSDKRAIAEVIGSQIEHHDFFQPDCRLVFETVTKLHYENTRADAVTVGDLLRKPLSAQWSCPEAEVPTRLASRTMGGDARAVMDHARIVKRHSDSRRLLNVIEAARRQIDDGQLTPEEIGDMIATEATQIVTGTAVRGTIMDWMEVGREYVKYLKRLRLAREQGIELAAYTGYKFVDHWTKGIAPGEMMIVGGPPGVGKSAVVWEWGKGFARRQMAKDKKIGTLVLSMEMGLVGSSTRIAQSIAGVEGDKLREGTISEPELARIIRQWKNHEGLPLYWNFASNFRLSQLRALVVEGIRRHNVGLVIVDHFRTIDPDRRVNNPNQEDEAKARFLREQIARDLNVAVVCIAHTVKIGSEDGRPRLKDLRGSGQVAAHADIVAFVFRPYEYATENEKLEGVVRPNEAELIFEKNRNGALGTSDFAFDAATMTVRDV